MDKQQTWEDFLDWDGGYDFSTMPETVILGLADSYDDPRINAVLYEYLRLRELNQ